MPTVSMITMVGSVVTKASHRNTGLPMHTSLPGNDIKVSPEGLIAFSQTGDSALTALLWTPFRRSSGP